MEDNDTSTFLPHEEMMQRLRPYDNLIKSIGALQYTTKFMQNQIPVIFRAWKEMVFEKKAKRLHQMLSTGSGNTSEIDNQLAHLSAAEANNQSRAVSSSADAYAKVGGSRLNRQIKNSTKGTDLIIKGD